jgi:hypothetical protein
MNFARSLAFGIVATTALQAPAPAAAPSSFDAETRLRHCGGATCLMVTGHRSDATAPVTLAGHAVTVQGARNWRVAVPLETVRAWSAPFARTIAVQIGGADGGAAMRARLPIGLLGHVTDLAFLDVRASR